MKKFFTLTLALMATICMYADDCTTLVSFATSQHQTSNPRKVYGYTTTEMTEDSRIELTCDNSNTKGVNNGAQIRLDYGKYLQIPTQTSVTSVTVDYFFYNTNSELSCNLKVEVGETVKQVEIKGKKTDDYKQAVFTFSPAATGTIKITHMGSGSSSYNLYLDNITYCTAPSVTYTVTLNPNGGSYASTPTGWTASAGNYTKNVSAGALTIPEPTKANFDFNGWKAGETAVALTDGKLTVSKDTTLVAQWIEHTTESSDATLSALSVAGCTFNETFDPAVTAYTVNLPFYASMPAVGDVTATKNDSYAEDPVVSISGNVITIACEAEDGTTLDYTVTVTIAPTPTASSSINIEQLVLDNGKGYDIETALSSAHISYANLNSLDSLAVGDKDNDRPDYNETFLGLKIKKSGGYIQMVIPAGNTLKVKFGSVAADLKLTINEVAQSNISKSTSVYEHTASGNELIKIATSSDKTVVLKQIMVGEDIADVRPFKATVAPTTNGTASVELPKYAKGDQVTVNCAPASGYQLDNIAVSGFDSKGVATNVEVTDGKFMMPGSPVTITVTFSVATAISNTADEAKAIKRLENGMLIIEKNGIRYNAQGQVIR